jgi:protein-S-isoprenylcysteine O-methyltransferase
VGAFHCAPKFFVRNREASRAASHLKSHLKHFLRVLLTAWGARAASRPGSRPGRSDQLAENPIPFAPDNAFGRLPNTAHWQRTLPGMLRASSIKKEIVILRGLRCVAPEAQPKHAFSMKLPSPLLLGALYGLSELWLAITRRSGEGAILRDRKSLRVLWIVIFFSVFFGIQVAFWFPSAAMPHRDAFHTIGFCLFMAGLALRWFAIGYLGKFFTVDVAIHPEQQLIEAGPYRFIRHPSYTGALLTFVGLGLSVGNWWSLAIFTLPVLAAFLVRIHVEECALLQAMGERYRSYQRRTKRLVPLLY